MRESQIARYMTPCPHTIGRNQTLETAHRMMRENHVRHLPVVERGMVVGLVSQRDLYFIETLKGVDAKEVTVEDAMSDPPFVVDAEAPLERVAREMAKQKYGCAVVAEKGEVVGLFTTTDALSALAGVLSQRRRAPAPVRAAQRRRL